MSYISIPFFPNLKDDTHCLQACLKMILKYCFPKENYSFKYLDKVTFHKKGKWTWNSAALLFLYKLNFSVIVIENFDYRQFEEFGEEYLKMLWTKEVFDTQKRYSDFIQERKLAKKLIKNKSIKLKRRGTNIKELEGIFKKKYFIMVPINPYVLDMEKGYSSHLVVVTGIDKKSITFHDPGLPPAKDRKVSRALFKKAMEYPNKECASLIAVRYEGCV